MPIISQIGRRSWKVRAVYAAIFTALTVGGLTMIYPFAMMIAGSFKSETDREGLSVYPAYWSDDGVLYQKYLEARYQTIDVLEPAHQHAYGGWRMIKPIHSLDSQWVEAYRKYRDIAQWPIAWFLIGQGEGTRYYRLHARLYRKMLWDQFDGSLEALNDHYGTGFVTWERLTLPPEQLHSRRYRSGIKRQENEFRISSETYKANITKWDRAPVNLDGYYWYTFLRPKYPTIDRYNSVCGTDYDSYRHVLLSRKPPVAGPQREDWETYVRNELNLSFIRLDEKAAPMFRRFLNQVDMYGDIDTYNNIHGTEHSAFGQIPFPLTVPDYERAQEDWSKFIESREFCALEMVEVYGPRQHFLDYLQDHGGYDLAKARGLPLPLTEADHLDLLDVKSPFRWEETKRNYIHVVEYVLLRGKAVRNTVIYCGLLILATLLVNPLAAYALSRYQPPSQYKVLLICMATMAFPGEVTMIPAFLLLKKFPVWNLLTGTCICAVVLYIGIKKFPKISDATLGLTAIAFGVASGWWIAPAVASMFGYDTTHTSLLNTFWALILPSMANGYGLFLLKGFFDSLPRELYESADIDGASEWTKFWSLTMTLSKPILAVLALGAFTSAYSEFMMALIIIPDRSMWTLMVWIFQLQMGAPQPVVLTSVLITAIPTFIVFVFCQNIIIRGIVVPVEK